MKIAVVGAGGVGGYFGGRLAQAGIDVTFLARGSHLAAIQTSGLRIESPLGDAHVTSVRAVAKADEVGPVDAIIFSVKMKDTEAAAESVRPLIVRGASLFTFQNGIESATRIGAVIGAENVVPGTAMIASTIVEPGLIRQTGTSGRLTCGELNHSASERTERFLAACQKAGIDAVLSNRIEWEVWNKFVHLASFAGMTSITRGSIGPVLRTSPTRKLLEGALIEATAVAAAHGIEFDDNSVHNRVAFLESLPAQTTSSMCVDLLAGRPLELEGLSGAVERFGAVKGVPTPIHSFIASVLAIHANGMSAAHQS
jgi:2-dehydropantoate 2-reductase